MDICFCAASVFNLNASDTRLDRETLTGVKSLYVIVAVPVNDGLDGGQIQADMVDRLRSAGINVTGLNRAAPLMPCLFASINVLKRQDGSRVYEASVSLNQAVGIVASNGSYMAPTWPVNTLGLATDSNVPRFIRSDVNDLADKFIRAYWGVNRR
jgi:hypothetical protein